MTSNPRHITPVDLFCIFHARKTFNKQFEYLLYKTNRKNFFLVCVSCNRSQKTSQRVKNNSHAARLRLVSYANYDVIYDLLQYTHARENVMHLLSTHYFTLANKAPLPLLPHQKCIIHA